MSHRDIGRIIFYVIEHFRNTHKINIIWILKNNKVFEYYTIAK